MKKFLSTLFLCTAISIVVASAQEKRTQIRSDRMEKFSKVSLSGKLSVELIPSGKDSLSIVLTDSELDKLKWSVTKEVLSVSLRPTPGGKGKAEVRIYYSQPIDAVTVSGSDVLFRERLKNKMLSFTVGGGGKLTAQAEALDLELSASGNSAVSLTGAAKYLTLRATENSKVNCRQLASVSAQVDAATAAEVFVWSSERAVMSAGSGATIFYRGKPSIIKESVSKIGLGASINNIGE